MGQDLPRDVGREEDDPTAFHHDRLRSGVRVEQILTNFAPLKVLSFPRATESFVVVPFELVKIKCVHADQPRGRLFLTPAIQTSRQVEHVRRSHGRVKDDRQERRPPRSLRRNGIHLLETLLVERRVLWVDLPSQVAITETNGSSPLIQCVCLRSCSRGASAGQSYRDEKQLAVWNSWRYSRYNFEYPVRVLETNHLE